MVKWYPFKQKWHKHIETNADKDDIAFVMKTVSENNNNNKKKDPKFSCFHGNRTGPFGLLELLNDGETYKPNTIDQITYCTAWL